MREANVADGTRENRLLAALPLDVVVKARSELVAASTFLAAELIGGQRSRSPPGRLAVLGEVELHMLLQSVPVMELVRAKLAFKHRFLPAFPPV